MITGVLHVTLHTCGKVQMGSIRPLGEVFVFVSHLLSWTVSVSYTYMYVLDSIQHSKYSNTSPFCILYTITQGVHVCSYAY